MNNYQFIVLSALAMFGLFGGAANSFAECRDSLPEDTPATRFVVQEGGVIIDRHSGLQWKRCIEGSSWSDGQCTTADIQSVSWQEALSQARWSDYAGYDDWRVPNKKELETIVERRCFEPAINTELFPGEVDGLFWSSTPNGVRPDVSWVIDFDSGAHRALPKSGVAKVRLVRDYSPAD